MKGSVVLVKPTNTVEFQIFCFVTYVCMYICMNMYICIYVYMRMYVCMRVFLYAKYLSVYVYIYI